MIINHPLLGPRDAAEFTYLGDASMIDRPDWQAEDAAEASSMTTPICATTLPASTESFGIMKQATGHGWSSRATPPHTRFPR